MAAEGYNPGTFDAFLTGIAVELAEIAAPVARQVIPSRTLRAQLTVEYLGPGRSALRLESFWALILHDGRGPVNPGKGARFLVYYVDARDDPRLRNGYPIYPQDQRRLTSTEFYEGVAENRRREQINPAGGPQQFMIVAKDNDGSPRSTGPAAGTYFFTEGMETFEAGVDDLILARFDDMVQAHLPRRENGPAIRISRLGS